MEAAHLATPGVGVGVGMFDHLSLASQLEGYASCPTSTSAASGNLKDLLLKATAGTNASSPASLQVFYRVFLDFTEFPGFRLCLLVCFYRVFPRHWNRGLLDWVYSLI